MSCPHYPRPEPVKPASRPERVSLLSYLWRFRQDILSAQPARLYRAWMAEFRTPFFTSFLCNDPELVDLVLSRRSEDFPKSNRLFEGLVPLLGHSVFITNGKEWERQRRIIDPAFESGRVREVFPVMWDAAAAAVERLGPVADGRPVDVETVTSHVALDVIFRAMFSIPVENDTAQSVFRAFRAHQAARPLLNSGSLLPLPAWFPRWRGRKARRTAKQIRALVEALVATRAQEIAEGRAPDDLATRIMTTPDAEDGRVFTAQEMVDQVGIFLLAGHETSAAALGWALYLMALFPEWQEKVAQEAEATIDPEKIYFSAGSKLRLSRAVFREALRLYPPVPMYLREAAQEEVFRGRKVPRGAQVIISPWHLHRHERLWDRPDSFDPTRWDSQEGRASARQAYLPFSEGPRVCPGSAFAMMEGQLILSMILQRYRVELVEGREPVPVAQLTVRGRDGIWLRFRPRGD
ncbi:cytochrome P450 [Shimia aestuarii]|uniref:cytochrome P450 n=1 Tax=Shimia aestuarii TaxID=254406 RepID=UPI001FB31D27|nr:cytochrome P450 [Shimia aestuarii]